MPGRIHIVQSLTRACKLHAVEQGRPMNKILREWIEKELAAQES